METTQQWFDRKEQFARLAIAEWQRQEKPVLIVVEAQTANAFNCVLSDCVRRIAGYGAKIYLAQHYETNLIEHFEKNYVVIYEDEAMQAK